MSGIAWCEWCMDFKLRTKMHVMRINCEACSVCGPCVDSMNCEICGKIVDPVDADDFIKTKLGDLAHTSCFNAEQEYKQERSY